MSPLISRPLAVRLVSVVACAVGFYLPLSVIPMFADAHGAAAAAGLANGALLGATVAAELSTPRLVERVGHRWALTLGLVLLGTPALLLLTPLGASVGATLVVNAVRGVGFAIAVVSGGALTAALLPADRRGEGLALVGLVGGVPSLLALPFGTWAADHWGYGAVFVLTAVVPLVGVASVPGLPPGLGRRPSAKTSSSRSSSLSPTGADPSGVVGVVAGLRDRRLVRPATVFATSASAAGVLVTYLPLAVGDRAGWVVPTALLAQPAASTVARWWAGRLGDRVGQARLLVPGVALSAAGMAAIAATGSGVAVVAGAAVFGAGFGVLQNASLALMYARVPTDAYAAVSAIWNGAYDLGMGLGAVAVGALVASTGYGVAFLLVAAAMLPALVLARREAGPDVVARPVTDAVHVPAPLNS
ncbi:MFS transporter [Intrasporangium flavum]|uniref:MFS transporter n=1 Tax=Intrasporangium flavum TaxID=1428657 RepID=UPI00096C49F6|nr:MFS transporter [Intrasporangium flavum]